MATFHRRKTRLQLNSQVSRKMLPQESTYIFLEIQKRLSATICNMRCKAGDVSYQNIESRVFETVKKNRENSF